MIGSILVISRCVITNLLA